MLEVKFKKPTDRRNEGRFVALKTTNSLRTELSNIVQQQVSS
jgi:hypothetical protein